MTREHCFLLMGYLLILTDIEFANFMYILVTCVTDDAGFKVMLDKNICLMQNI